MLIVLHTLVCTVLTSVAGRFAAGALPCDGPSPRLRLPSSTTHTTEAQTCLRVAYARVESSLETLNARVRVSSRVAGRNFNSSCKSCQYNIMNIPRCSTQVAFARVESSLESLNVRVRVESRVAGRDLNSSRKSSQYNIMNIPRCTTQLCVLLAI